MAVGKLGMVPAVSTASSSAALAAAGAAAGADMGASSSASCAVVNAARPSLREKAASFAPVSRCLAATFAAARAHCQAIGGDLASIHSAAENAEAAALVGEGSALIGFTDSANEGNWIWTDGTVDSYANWDEGQPEYEEDCAAISDSSTI